MPRQGGQGDLAWEVGLVDLVQFLDVELGEERKELLERKRQASSHLSKLERALRDGDLEQASRAVGWIEATFAKQQEAVGRLKERLPTYDVSRYLREEFHEAFVTACRSEGLRVVGGFPDYEVFPFRVRVYPERRAIEVDGHVVRFLRPERLAAYLKLQTVRLEKQNFNPTRFVDTLALTYDLILAQRQVKLGIDMQRDLDVSLVEVFVHDAFETSDGRRLVLGDTRQRGKAIIVYDANGREHRYGSLRFTARGDSE